MPPPPGGDQKQTKTKKKKKKGRAPAHQNSYAFRHNPKSKKTTKILSSPNVGVCERCRDKIEWRKRYRKYRPLSHPAKCNLCSRRNVYAAYHTLCGECASGDVAFDIMERRRRGNTTTTSTTTTTSAATTGGVVVPVDDAATTTTSTSTSTNAESDPTPAAPSSSRRRRRMRLRVCAVCASEPATSEFSDVHPDDVDVVLRIEELEYSLKTGLRLVVVIDDDDDIDGNNDDNGGERDDDGNNGGGTKMTLREIRGVERSIEKCREELGERKRMRTMAAATAAREGEGRGKGEEEEEVGGGDDGVAASENDDDGSSDDGNDDDDDGKDLAEDNDGRLDDRAKGGVDLEDEEDDPFLLATGGRALVGEDYRRMMLERG